MFLEEKHQEIKNTEQADQDNLLAFFDLLLQIDRRNKEKEKILNHPLATRRVQDQPSKN